MICRLCLNNLDETKAVQLFGTDVDRHLVQMIANYLYLELSRDDAISTNVCTDCCEHLENFHRFWMLVEEKQNTLRNEYPEINCDVKWITVDDNDDAFYGEQTVNDSGGEAGGGDGGYDPQHTTTIDIKEENDLQRLTAIGEAENEYCSTNIKEEQIEKNTLCTNGRKPKRKLKTIADKQDIHNNNEHDNADATDVDDAMKPKRPNTLVIFKDNEEVVSSFMKLHCDVCADDLLGYETFTELRLHFNKVHNKSPYVKCCNVIFNRLSRLVEHVRWHQNPDEFRCQYCHKVMRSKTNLLNHIKVVHNDEHENGEAHVLYPCHICKQKLITQKRLDTHLLRHEDEFKFQCEICVKDFQSDQHLRKHINTMHENENPYECDECGKICTTRVALNGHIKYAHKLQNRFPCEYCEKSFKLKRYLDEHMATHLGTKLHTCPHCPTEFRCKSNMYAHVKRKHVDAWQRARDVRNANANIMPPGAHDLNKAKEEETKADNESEADAMADVTN